MTTAAAQIHRRVNWTQVLRLLLHVIRVLCFFFSALLCTPPTVTPLTFFLSYLNLSILPLLSSPLFPRAFYVNSPFDFVSLLPYSPLFFPPPPHFCTRVDGRGDSSPCLPPDCCDPSSTAQSKPTPPPNPPPFLFLQTCVRPLQLLTLNTDKPGEWKQ